MYTEIKRRAMVAPRKVAASRKTNNENSKNDVSIKLEKSPLFSPLRVFKSPVQRTLCKRKPMVMLTDMALEMSNKDNRNVTSTSKQNAINVRNNSTNPAKKNSTLRNDSMFISEDEDVGPSPSVSSTKILLKNEDFSSKNPPKFTRENVILQESEQRTENSMYFSRYLSKNVVQVENKEVPSSEGNEDTEQIRNTQKNSSKILNDMRLFNFEDQIPFAFVAIKNQENDDTVLVPVYKGDGIVLKNNEPKSTNPKNYNADADLLLPSKFSDLSMKDQGSNKKKAANKNIFKKKPSTVSAAKKKAPAKSMKIKWSSFKKPTDANSKGSDFEEVFDVPLEHRKVLSTKSRTENSKRPKSQELFDSPPLFSSASSATKKLKLTN